MKRTNLIIASTFALLIGGLSSNAHAIIPSSLIVKLSAIFGAKVGPHATKKIDDVVNQTPPPDSGDNSIPPEFLIQQGATQTTKQVLRNQREDEDRSEEETDNDSPERDQESSLR